MDSDGQDCLVDLANHSNHLEKLDEACPEFLCILRGSSQQLEFDLGGCHWESH